MDLLDLLNIPSFGKQRQPTWREFFIWVPITVVATIAVIYFAR